MALSDSELAKIMYGEKAVVDVKPSKIAVRICKDKSNNTKKDLYEADFAAYAKKYSEDHNVKKADLYVD